MHTGVFSHVVMRSWRGALLSHSAHWTYGPSAAQEEHQNTLRLISHKHTFTSHLNKYQWLNMLTGPRTTQRVNGIAQSAVMLINGYSLLAHNIKTQGALPTLLSNLDLPASEVGLFDVLDAEVCIGLGVLLLFIAGRGFVIGAVSVRGGWKRVNVMKKKKM